MDMEGKSTSDGLERQFFYQVRERRVICQYLFLSGTSKRSKASSIGSRHRRDGRSTPTEIDFLVRMLVY